MHISGMEDLCCTSCDYQWDSLESEWCYWCDREGQRIQRKRRGSFRQSSRTEYFAGIS